MQFSSEVRQHGPGRQYSCDHKCCLHIILDLSLLSFFTFSYLCCIMLYMPAFIIWSEFGHWTDSTWLILSAGPNSYKNYSLIP
jgi:hypothetical protein